ncbi:MAG: Rrf2 family transcriptional regulator [Bacteroidales bacterium]|jgi:Rrf2 family protein|nr:Rrf2 family transcriptional regulator [Bacteroidales bacterium]MDD3664309.1 Rrf2 family transcriptional regulator [Bacteroidales bacterium]
MSKILNISEAASIAIHSMALIAASGERLNVGMLAQRTSFSKNHIAKVLNQLVKNNFLLSERGPNGGFVLSRPAESINLLSVYESVEGSLDIPVCTMKCSLCEQSGCVFGGLSGKFQKEFREYLQRKMVSDLIKL